MTYMYVYKAGSKRNKVSKCCSNSKSMMLRIQECCSNLNKLSTQKCFGNCISESLWIHMYTAPLPLYPMFLDYITISSLIAFSKNNYMTDCFNHLTTFSPEEGHRSPKVLGKYYSYSTGVIAHGYLRAFTSETHAQVSETARTGAAAGHSEESGRERRHAPLRGALPLRGPHPYILTHCLQQK